MLTRTPRDTAVPAQPRFGIDAPPGAIGRRRNGAGLVEARATAVAVDAGGAAVDDAAARAAPRAARAAAFAVRGSVLALQRRRREVQHRVGQAGRRAQRRWPVEVGHQRHDAGGAQLGAARRSWRSSRSAASGRAAGAARACRCRRSRRSAASGACGAPGSHRQGSWGSWGNGAQFEAPLPCQSTTRVMTFTVTVQPSGRTFSVERDEPILARRHPPGHRPALRLQGRRLRLLQVPPARRPRDPRRAPGQGAVARRRGRRLHR